MKLQETVTLDPSTGAVVVQELHDFQPVVDEARYLRDAGKAHQGDSRFVGVIDPKMWEMWAREAGISFNDPDLMGKMKEVVRRKMLSGEFSKLRVWHGTY